MGGLWAQLWEKYFQQRMKRPNEADIFDFSRQ